MENFKVVEEIARVEQRLAAKDGKIIGLEDTESFKRLKPEEKTKFNLYKKRIGLGRKVAYGLVLFGFVLIVLTRAGITGQVIGISESTLSLLQIFGVVFLIAVLAIFVSISIAEKRIDKRFRENLKIIEKYV